MPSVYHMSLLYFKEFHDRRPWREWWESHLPIMGFSDLYNIMPKWTFAVWLGIQPMPCDSLEGWEAGGSFKREGTYVYLRLIHCWCMKETNTTLQSNYPPIKNKFKTNNKKELFLGIHNLGNCSAQEAWLMACLSFWQTFFTEFNHF